MPASGKGGRSGCVFGNGETKANPIHGADLAVVCVDAIDNPDREIKVGGPEILTHNEIAAAAFEAAGTELKVIHIPNWVRTALIRMVRIFSGSRVYGPIEFLLTVMAIDMVAPEYGKLRLKEYFESFSDGGMG